MAPHLRLQSTKTYTHAHGLSCCFRQWKADSHCKYLHGYSLEVKLKFEGRSDEKGWVVDFGGLKEIKTWLEKEFDHKTLVAIDDPDKETFVMLHKAGLIDMNIVAATGCEAFALMIFNEVNHWVELATNYRSHLVSVEVREHGGNSAIALIEDQP